VWPSSLAPCAGVSASRRMAWKCITCAPVKAQSERATLIRCRYVRNIIVALLVCMDLALRDSPSITGLPSLTCWQIRKKGLAFLRAAC